MEALFSVCGGGLLICWSVPTGREQCIHRYSTGLLLTAELGLVVIGYVCLSRVLVAPGSSVADLLLCYA